MFNISSSSTMYSTSPSALPMFLAHTSPVGNGLLTTHLIGSSPTDHLLPSSALSSPSTVMDATTDNSTLNDCYSHESLETVTWPLAQYFLIGLYSCTSLLALLGNLVVLLVSSLGSESAPTIRLCLANLAVSDVILAVFCVPLTFSDFMLGRWVFPHFVCPLAQFVQLLSVFVTSTTLMVVGIERYHATLCPFSSVHRWLCSHTRPLLLSTWLIGALYASIILPHTGTRAFTIENSNVTYYECSYDNGISPTQRRLFMTTNLLLTFLLPLLVLITAYTAIMRKLIAEQSPAKADTTTTTNNTSSSLYRPQTYHFTNNSNGTTTTTAAAATAAAASLSINPTNGVTKTLVVVSRREEKAAQRKKRKKKRKSELPTEVGNGQMMKGDGAALVVAEQSVTGTKMKNGSGGEGSSPPPDAALSLFSNGSSRHLRLVYQAGGRKKSATALQLNSAVSLRKSANTNRSKTIKMLFVVMALYGICWAPIKLYQFLIDYGVLSYCSEFSMQALVVAYFACHWLAMANSAVNPCIYSFMSASFRNDFRKITSSFRLGGRPSSKINRHFSLRTASTMV